MILAWASPFKDLKRYIAHVHKDWYTEKGTVSHTQHPSLPNSGKLNLTWYRP